MQNSDEKRKKADAKLAKKLKEMQSVRSEHVLSVKANRESPTVPSEQLHTSLPSAQNNTPVHIFLDVVGADGKKESIKYSSSILPEGIPRKLPSCELYKLKSKNNEFEAVLDKIPDDHEKLCRTIMRMIDDIVFITKSTNLVIETDDPLAKRLCQAYVQALGLQCNLTNQPIAASSANIGELISERAEKIKQTDWFQEIIPPTSPRPRI